MKTFSPETYIEMIETTPVYHRTISQPPKYQPGDVILTANLNPESHTRLPRYARSKKGRVLDNYGACVFPDSLVASKEENPQHVYLVQFSAKELWGDAAGNFTVNLSLFDEYIVGKA